MLSDLPVELLSLILTFLNITSLKNAADSCRLLRAVCSDHVLNPWRHPVRRAIDTLFVDGFAKEEAQTTPKSKDYPHNLTTTSPEAQDLAVLSVLSELSSVPRSTLVDVLALSPPRFLLYCASRSNLPRKLWEEAFRRRFLPSWAHTLERQKWSWREGFFRTLEQVNHKLTSSCTSNESWISYVVILRSGVAATCTAYARTFSAGVIMGDLKRQANLLDYETQARVIVQLADVRIVMLGVLRKPPYFAVNTHAQVLLHPHGAEKWGEHSETKRPSLSQPPEPQHSLSFPPPGVLASPSESPAPSPSARRRVPLAASRTRSPSGERRRENNNLRLTRTLTHESTTSTAESASSSSRGLMGRLRRWTLGSNNTAERQPQPDSGPSRPSPARNIDITSPRSPSWATSSVTQNTSMPHNSTPNVIASPDVLARRPQSEELPRLRHPEPSSNHARYPNYTPGGGDFRWRVEDGVEEGGLFWVGPLLIVAQLVPHGMANASKVENVGEVFSQRHHVSFRWDDLIAIAPWMEDRLTRRDDGLTL